jgi:hypothetical protein
MPSNSTRSTGSKMDCKLLHFLIMLATTLEWSIWSLRWIHSLSLYKCVLSTVFYLLCYHQQLGLSTRLVHVANYVAQYYRWHSPDHESKKKKKKKKRWLVSLAYWVHFIAYDALSSSRWLSPYPWACHDILPRRRKCVFYSFFSTAQAGQIR